MTASIERLQAIFRENSLHNLLALRRMPDEARDRLDASVYAWFAAFKQPHIKTLDNGLNLCLSLGNDIDDYLLGNPLETAVKKLSFFSQTGVLLTPKFRHPGVRGKLIPDAWYHLTLAYMPLIQNGMLTILPKGMTYLQDTGSVQGETFIILRKPARHVEKTWFLFKEEIPSLKPIDLSGKALQKQMLEICPNYGLQTKPSGYMYLPHLSNVPVETMVLMRQHHGDTFQRYNATVERFFSGTAKAKTERRMLELMQETDENIRKIEAEMNKISSSKALQAQGIILKLGVAALCPLLPKNVAPGALSFLGGNIVSDATRYIQLRNEQKAMRDASPFYFPWLVHSKSKKLAL
jgi:hypothetical protein